MRKKAGIIVLISVALLIIAGVATWIYISERLEIPSAVRIYVPKDATESAIQDSLMNGLGEKMGRKVAKLRSMTKRDPAAAHGSYVVNPGERAYEVALRIARGRQTPVRITVTSARTLRDFTEKIGSKIEASPSDLYNAIDSIARTSDDFRTKEEVPAAVIPDTYEFYWNAPAASVAQKLISETERFWDSGGRREAARKLGLRPAQVATLASIVAEESSKPAEYPLIGRLYLNRLNRGMKLQADPTVKFALGDFNLRRIIAKHLSVPSRYNTYLYTGLPPGPIRIADKAVIDSVLNASPHNYIYMCAREDFSGYHNFAVSYEDHLRNARRYASELDRRGIH